MHKLILHKSNFLWLLDPGHGGIIDGKYQTAGKRSPVWPDSRQLFEGEFNRSIIELLIPMLYLAKIDYINLVPTKKDISLGTRTRKANKIYKKDRRAIYLSVHGNAGGGTGYEIWTSKGQTRSDLIATIFYNEMEKVFPNMKYRPDNSDGDVDKEANYYVLKNTNMPAVLTENFFMDTLNPDCELMMSKEGRIKIARAHYNAILFAEQNGINF